MKILITGSNGLLGQKIVKQLVNRNVDFIATSLGRNRNSKCPGNRYTSLDITKIEKVDEVIKSFEPDVIINTAAMTNVDACEENESDCININVNAVEILFNKCKSRNIHFIHLSTDFVFDGENGPYKESDKRNPLSIYAKSKVDSENILMDSDYKNWAILRTIIVFGDAENLSRSNIVLWAKQALAEKKELTIVDDQFRAPTWADDLAWACIQTAIERHLGIFHISGPETFSIFDLVCRIAEYHGFDKNLIKPISSKSLNQKAKRPAKTGFNIDKARTNLAYRPMILEESLKYLENEVR